MIQYLSTVRRVQDVGTKRRKRLLLDTGIPLAEAPLLRVGDTVELRRPDSLLVMTRILELTHIDVAPGSREDTTLWLRLSAVTRKADVPIGTEIWLHEAVAG